MDGLLTLKALLSLAKGVHKHRCPNCDTVWEHPNRIMLENRDVHDWAHSCPECGQRVARKYYGPRPANYVQHDERGY